MRPNDHEDYNYYAVELAPSKETSLERASKLAQANDLHLIGRIGELDHHYLLAAPKHSLVKREPIEITSNLLADEQVHWVEQQVPQRRLFKRIPPQPLLFSNNSDFSDLNNQKRRPGAPQKVSQIAASLGIKDPGFPEQFHLYNTIEIGHDLNLTGVWAQNITGKGVVITLLDDGVDHEHPDLKVNFFEPGSWDFNEHKRLPTPALSDDYHGTRCAGEVSAAKNDVCGVGIAWDSKVSGIRILSGDLTISDEAAAITYEYHKNHIYSCSWGPRDDGRTMEAPPKLAMDAFKKGIDSGRNGLGSIYVFAAGNGGASGDNCNFDGYTNSIYTITVGAIERGNQHPSYSEICSANLVVTYSGPHGGQGIYTTDWLGHACTNRHGGTSAAAPLASGVFALVLSIRPDLTWRDIQHLVVQSAVPITLDDPDWKTVAKGRRFNHKFGYGVLDGYRIVEAAKTHKLVNRQTHIESPVLQVNQDLPEEEQGISHVFTVNDSLLAKNNFTRLEHVTVTINVDHQRRGDVSVYLTSPSGSVSEMLVGRSGDWDARGFPDWTMMSVKHWDEEVRGNWTLRIADKAVNNLKGKWNNWRITLWGESNQPNIIENPSPPSKEPEKSPVPSSVSTPVSMTTLVSATGIVKTTDLPVLNPGTAHPIVGEPNPFGVLAGILMFSVLMMGCLSALILWHRISKTKAGDTEREEMYEFERLNGDDDLEDAFGDEGSRQSHESSRRDRSLELRNREILFDPGLASDDEGHF